MEWVVDDSGGERMVVSVEDLSCADIAGMAEYRGFGVGTGEGGGDARFVKV